jgi:hypothetical protein
LQIHIFFQGILATEETDRQHLRDTQTQILKLERLLEKLVSFFSSFIFFKAKQKKKNWEHEVMTQQHEQSSINLALLRDQLSERMLTVRQKAGMHKMTLARQAKAHRREHEQAETALLELIRGLNLDEQKFDHTLQDAVQAKEKETEALDARLAELAQRRASVSGAVRRLGVLFDFAPEDVGVLET